MADDVRDRAIDIEPLELEPVCWFDIDLGENRMRGRQLEFGWV